MYYTKTSNGIEVAKRDIIDDLKDVINRYSKNGSGRSFGE